MVICFVIMLGSDRSLMKNTLAVKAVLNEVIKNNKAVCVHRGKKDFLVSRHLLCTCNTKLKCNQTVPFYGIFFEQERSQYIGIQKSKFSKTNFGEVKHRDKLWR